jgi:hypothetical protein
MGIFPTSVGLPEQLFIFVHKSFPNSGQRRFLHFEIFKGGQELPKDHTVFLHKIM